MWPFFSRNLLLHRQNPECWQAMKHVISTYNHKVHPSLICSGLICWIQGKGNGKRIERRGEVSKSKGGIVVIICPSGTFLLHALEIWPWTLYHTAPALKAVLLAWRVLELFKTPRSPPEYVWDADSNGLISADVKSSPAHVILNHRSPTIHSHYLPILDFHLIWWELFWEERESHSPDTNLKRQSKVINSQTGDCKLNYWDGEPGGGRDQQWEPVSHLSISKAFRAGEGAVSFWIVARDQWWLKLTWA